MNANKQLIDNPEVAGKITALTLDITAQLNQSVWLVQDDQGRDGSAAYRRAVGKVMGEILAEVLNPLYCEHPKLKPKDFE